MVQILGFFQNTWNNISFSIVSGLYSIVAKIYNFMLDLVRTGSIDTSPFDDFTTTLYVLAGVFMLFRVIIGMLQMLINPDQINDKQAGAGKMIQRIVLCIVMLMLFVPNGIIFGENGIFHRVEEALLAEDGLVTKLSGMGDENFSSSPTQKNIVKEGTAGFLIENVYADTKADLTCYYFNVASHSKSTETAGTGTYTLHKMEVNKFYKIEFYNSVNVSGNSGDQTGKLNCSSGSCKYSYIVRSSETIEDDLGNFSSLNGKITMGDAFSDSFPTSCPEYLEKKTNSSGSTYYAATKKHPVSNKIQTCKNKWGLTRITDGKCYNVGIMGGYSDLSKALENIKKILTDYTNNAKTKYSVKTDENSVLDNLSNFVNRENSDSGSVSYLNGISNSAIVFAQGTASSLQECASGYEDDCEEAQKEMFESSDGNDKIVELMDNKQLDVGFFMSLITGIALIVYLLFLCVEILIRKLKLYFLEIIAPIPVISYVDPKDKVFNQWMKMYLSTYVDLFIKLISIGVAVTLLEAIFADDFWQNANLLMKFFEIVAILAFAKILPTMISKIFGLDSMGGSFKDVMGMAKGAAGFAAGGALGAFAGAATGKGLGRFSGALKGATMGVGSGAKGKVFGGSQAISSRNAAINQQKAAGLNMFERMIAGASAKTGIAPGAKAESKMEAASAAFDAQSKYKKYLLDQAKKKDVEINESAPIMSKDKKRAVTHQGEKISMKSEYAKQSNLAGLTAEQWNNMSTTERQSAFGAQAGSFNSLVEAQVFQNDRVAALEDYAAANMANKLSGDQENIKEYNAMKDTVSKAKRVGVQIEDVAELGDFNKGTLSQVKDQALAGYNEAAASSSLKIKKNIQS